MKPLMTEFVEQNLLGGHDRHEWNEQGKKRSLFLQCRTLEGPQRVQWAGMEGSNHPYRHGIRCRFSSPFVRSLFRRQIPRYGPFRLGGPLSIIANRLKKWPAKNSRQIRPHHIPSYMAKTKWLQVIFFVIRAASSTHPIHYSLGMWVRPSGGGGDRNQPVGLLLLIFFRAIFRSDRIIAPQPSPHLIHSVRWRLSCPCPSH